MSGFQDIARNIFADMPPETRFGEDDAACLAKHRELLLGLEDKIAQGFYDVLYAHPNTAAILEGSERDLRESVLRNWWRKTLTSRFGRDYWEWQVFVGLIHIKRKVSNPMMMSMWGWLLNVLTEELAGQLDEEDTAAVKTAFVRLASTVQALTAESVLRNSLAAITSATGFNPKLLDKLVSMQIDHLIDTLRADP